MSYEYKVVPAPMRGMKAKGVKTAEDRFAYALETAMNELASDGWEYLRADTLPCEQREGLMSKTTVYQNMLVFRRAKPAKTRTETPPPVAAPKPQIAAEPTVEKKLITSAPASDPQPAAPSDKKPDSSGVAAE